jgi:hypothetical protein
VPNFGKGIPKPKPPTKSATSTFTTEKERKEGVITTLSVTVVHSAYFFSVRPEDIFFEQTTSGRAYSVEKFKISGGAGKVTQLEIGLRLTDTSEGKKPPPAKFQDFWSTLL